MVTPHLMGPHAVARPIHSQNEWRLTSRCRMTQAIRWSMRPWLTPASAPLPSMKKNRRRPSHPPAELQESVFTLHDAAKDSVLDAARLWREQKGVAWTARVLASALDLLAGSETVLGDVLDLAPMDESAAPVPNEWARH